MAVQLLEEYYQSKKADLKRELDNYQKAFKEDKVFHVLKAIKIKIKVLQESLKPKINRLR